MQGFLLVSVTLFRGPLHTSTLRRLQVPCLRTKLGEFATSVIPSSRRQRKIPRATLYPPYIRLPSDTPDLLRRCWWLSDTTPPHRKLKRRSRRHETRMICIRRPIGDDTDENQTVLFLLLLLFPSPSRHPPCPTSPPTHSNTSSRS
jgi:hypothetical protein